MSYHVVNVDSVGCTVTCKDQQLVCISQDGDSRTVPLEDVGSIVVTSFKATLTNRLLVESAKHGITLVVCDGFKPAGIMVPVNRSSDTLLTRAHLAVHARQRGVLWRRTIDAKVRNQWLLCREWSAAHRGSIALASMQNSSGNHKEALAARHHWRVFGDALALPGFRRDRKGGGVNCLLNYGYGVLLSVVTQRMLAIGIDPTFGIAHVAREKALPLAYDLMEPFRPWVDAEVVNQVKRHGGAHRVAMDRDTRAALGEVVVKPVRRGTNAVERRIVIEEVLRSFREAVMERKPSLYKPWTPKASRWDGCS